MRDLDLTRPRRTSITVRGGEEWWDQLPCEVPALHPCLPCPVGTLSLGRSSRLTRIEPFSVWAHSSSSLSERLLAYGYDTMPYFFGDGGGRSGMLFLLLL